MIKVSRPPKFNAFLVWKSFMSGFCLLDNRKEEECVSWEPQFLNGPVQTHFGHLFASFSFLTEQDSGLACKF